MISCCHHLGTNRRTRHRQAVVVGSTRVRYECPGRSRDNQGPDCAALHRPPEHLHRHSCLANITCLSRLDREPTKIEDNRRHTSKPPTGDHQASNGVIEVLHAPAPPFMSTVRWARLTNLQRCLRGLPSAGPWSRTATVGRWCLQPADHAGHELIRLHVAEGVAVQSACDPRKNSGSISRCKLDVSYANPAATQSRVVVCGYVRIADLDVHGHLLV